MLKIFATAFISLLLLLSISAQGYERSCSAQLTAMVGFGDEILLATISAKGQHSIANKAREKARNRAVACLSDLVAHRFVNLGAKSLSYAPSSCTGSNISGLQDSEIDIETKVRAAACLYHRGFIVSGYFDARYLITTYGGNFCGGPKDNYADTITVTVSPNWPNNFCRVFGFDFFLPY